MALETLDALPIRSSPRISGRQKSHSAILAVSQFVHVSKIGRSNRKTIRSRRLTATSQQTCSSKESTTRVNPRFTKPSPQQRAQLLLTNLFGIEISVLTQQNLELPLKPWDTQICLACLASTAENSHEAKKKPSRSLSLGNSDRISSTDLVGNTMGFLLILPLNPAIEYPHLAPLLLLSLHSIPECIQLILTRERLFQTNKWKTTQKGNTYHAFGGKLVVCRKLILDIEET